MDKKALQYILSRMTYYTRLLSSRRCFSKSACYSIVDFCVSLLHLCGIYVAWDDTSKSWEIVSSYN